MIEIKAAVLDGNVSFVENDNLAVQQLIEIYVEANVTSWKPTTKRDHLYIMENYMLNVIGQNKIKNVNNLVIQRELMDPLIKSGYKEGTLIAIYRRLNAVFMFAVKNEILDRKGFLRLI